MHANSFVIFNNEVKVNAKELLLCISLLAEQEKGIQATLIQVNFA